MEKVDYKDLKRGERVVFFGPTTHLPLILDRIGREGWIVAICPLKVDNVEALAALPNVRLIHEGTLSSTFLDLCIWLKRVPPIELPKVRVLVYEPFLMEIFSRDGYGRLLRALLRHPGVNISSAWPGSVMPNEAERLRELLELVILASPGVVTLYEGVSKQKGRYPIANEDRRGGFIRDKVSIIIQCWNQWHFTKRCIKSVLNKTDYPNFDIIVINNASTDFTGRGLRSLAARHTKMNVITNKENLGACKARDQGGFASDSEFLLFLDNDTEITDPAWVNCLVETIKFHPRIGATGQLGVFHRFDESRHFFQSVHVPDLVVPINWCSSYCFMMRNVAFQEVGGWKPDIFGTIGWEDTGICYALRERGWVVTTTKKVVGLMHYIGSRERMRVVREEIDFRKRGCEAFRALYGETIRILNCGTPGNETAKGVWSPDRAEYINP
jgi:hypothetical protein